MTGRGVPVVVAGLGAMTVVGKRAPTSASAVRAGICRIGDHPFLFDVDGDPFQVAQASYLEIDLRGSARLEALAGPAIAEALEPLAPLASRQPSVVVPIFLGLPASRPGRPHDIVAAMTRRAHEGVARAGLSPGAVRVFETGHAAGTMALQAAWELCRSGGAELVLCGGVESYLEPDTMAWLEASRRVHGADHDPWGFAPGEAAGFVLLSSARVAEQLGLPVALQLLVVATARETKLIQSDAVCIGEGLTALVHALAAALPPGIRIDQLVCDMNGEPYRADELGFALARVGEHFVDPSSLDTPATSWGDVGAASGPLFLALADGAVRWGRHRGPVLAACTSADSGERSGFVVRVLENTPSRRWG